MRKKLFLIIAGGFFITLTLLNTNFSLAQGDRPPPPIFPSAPAQNPIDGGLGLLAAAGGAYAIKKLRDKKK